MLPQVLAIISPISKSNGNVFKDIIISNLIAVPKTMIGGFLSELKLLGRKNTISFSFICTTFASILVIVDINNIYFYAGIIKLMTGISMAVVKIYSTEAYPTKIRGLGYGTGHSFARLAGMLVPFICEGLWYSIGMLAPFFFILITSILAVYNTYLLPFETLGRTLDKFEKEDALELKQYKDF
jgi:hypothetical protein